MSVAPATLITLGSALLLAGAAQTFADARFKRSNHEIFGRNHLAHASAILLVCGILLSVVLILI